MLSLVNLCLAYGGPPLLKEASMDLLPKDRMALIGRNGAGKSSLLKVIAGEIKADSGERATVGKPRVAILPQQIPDHPDASVGDLLKAPLARASLEDWEIDAALDKGLSSLGMPGDTCYGTLSSGQKRQVLLVGCLIDEPDILLLDEPTNHLDVESIEWMEGLLRKFRGALLFISHDRAFIRSVGTTILDLDRGKLTRWNCDYDTYLIRKEEALAAEAKEHALFDKKLAQEEVWIRQGIKARRTRNEGRVRNLEKMREAHRQRRQRTGSVRMDATGGAGLSGRKVITAEEISTAYHGRPLFRPFSCEILRGDRIGILGPNGCGKSTLVKLLLHELQPDTGTVSHGTNLQIAYFDQNRDQLDDSLTVIENIAEGKDFVEVGGQRKHAISHLKDFLFTSSQAQAPIHHLSGGERNRLLLAKLFTRPFNVLVMDEPTNDLDLETLELLEEQLDEFAGTLILVSHDRAFIDNVVTELFVFGPDRTIHPIIGGYRDYLLFKERSESPAQATVSNAPETPRKKSGKPPKARTFLNREQNELDALPAAIESLEQEQERLANDLSDPAKLRQNPQLVHEANHRIEQITALLEQKYQRWEELEFLKRTLPTN